MAWLIREQRVNAGLVRARAGGKTLGQRLAVVQDAIRVRLEAGTGMLKVARDLGVGTSTVQRIRREMHAVQPD